MRPKVEIRCPLCALRFAHLGRAWGRTGDLHRSHGPSGQRFPAHCFRPLRASRTATPETTSNLFPSTVGRSFYRAIGPSATSHSVVARTPRKSGAHPAAPADRDATAHTRTRPREDQSFDPIDVLHSFHDQHPTSARSATSKVRWSGQASTWRGNRGPPDHGRVARPPLEVADVFRAHGTARRNANARSSICGCSREAIDPKPH